MFPRQKNPRGSCYSHGIFLFRFGALFQYLHIFIIFARQSFWGALPLLPRATPIMKKTKLSIFTVIVLASLIAMTSVSCEKLFQKPSITSFNIAKVSLNGLKSLRAVVDLGLSNPNAFPLNMTSIGGVLYLGDTPLITFTADSIVLEASSAKVYQLPLEGTISEQASLPLLLKFAASPNIDELQVEFVAKV